MRGWEGSDAVPPGTAWALMSFEWLRTLQDVLARTHIV